MSQFGHRSKPAKRTGVADHTSLLEAPLIPLADNANHAAASSGDIKIGNVEIAPTPAQQEIFAGVERRELLSGIVAVQAFDDLGKKGEAATFDVATRFDGTLDARDIDAAAVKAAHRVIGGQASAPSRKRRQGVRVLRKDCCRIEQGAAIRMELPQEAVSSGEQAASS